MKAPENISSSDSSSKCIVPTCGNSFRLQSSSYTGHSFPRDVTIRSEWMTALRSTESSILERNINLDSAQICSDHFTPECFQQTEGQRNLLESAIPTLFGSADDGKRSDPQDQQSPTTDKAKHCPIKAQEQMRKLIEDVLKCTDGMDHPDNVKSTSTMFRLKRFPHVCRLCLMPKKSRQVLIPTNATDYEFDGDSIDEFLFDILPPGATLDKDKQHLLPTDVCKPCYELLKFFARYRSKIATVHRLMNALVELKHFNTRPIVELFNSKTNTVRRVIKDLGLCRLNSYTVDDLIDEFPLYDLATFEGFVIKQEEEEEAEEVPDQVEVICEEVKMELNDFPMDLGAIYAEECTAEEVKELTMNNLDIMVVEPKAAEKKPVVKKIRQGPVQKVDDGQPKKVRKLYGGRKGKELKQCEKCEYHTYYAKSFRSHQMTHERKENRVYRCKHPNCTEEFKTSAESYRHSTVKHKSHICETCGQACSTKYALASHMERHLKLYEYACTYCEKKKPTKRDLDFHIRRRHLNAVQYHCKTCAMVFNIKTTLDEHERTHGDAYDFHCTQCDKKFKRQKALARHIRKVHENFRVSCPHCDNTFSSAYNLNNHIECAHGIQTRFVCDICVLTLLSQEKLDLHRAQHLRPHELQCGTCLSVCMDQQQMADHLCITYRKRSDLQDHQSSTVDKAKLCPIKAQEQMRKLIEDVLKCTDGTDHPDNVKSTSTLFRLKRFPHVCRLCLMPKKYRQVLIPTDATDQEFDGDSIEEFLFDILPPGATLDKDKQHLLPNGVCQPCYELLKFFARYRSKIAIVHRLMNALIELKHFNSRPIMELFNSKADTMRMVIKDLGLCRLNSYTVDDLIDEFPFYDLATFEGFVIKQDEEEEEEIPDQVEVVCEEVKIELKDFPVDLGAIYAEECTAEEVKELTVDNVDVMVVEPKAVEKKTMAKKKRQRPVQKLDNGEPKKVRKLYGGGKSKELKQCEKCDYHTYYAKRLRSHQMTHDTKENRVYRCKYPNCTEEFKTSKESYRHSLIKHKSHICESCGQACSTKYALATHMERHLKLYEYACTYCEKKKTTKRDLDFHIRRKHLNAVQYHCKTCGLVFIRKTSLDEHERTHGDTYDFHCTQCDKKFKRQKALTRHIRLVHENFRVTCPHCDNTFSSAYDLNNHIECAHGIQTRFVCDICVLTLLSQEKLDLHRAQHLRPHELQCGTCLSVCMDQQQMADHLCITYRDDYFCCGRDHRYHYMYNKHMLVKHGIKTNARVKPIPGELMGRMRAQRKRVETCPKCEQVFATRTLKKQHMDICTGGADDTELQRTTGDIMMQVETS